MKAFSQICYEHIYPEDSRGAYPITACIVINFCHRIVHSITYSVHCADITLICLIDAHNAILIHKIQLTS